MIVSMTGFGDATAERDGTHYSVEIRSLNHRFFKPVIKLPDNVSGLEPEALAQRLRTAVAEAHGLLPREVVLLRSGVIPRSMPSMIERLASWRTSSGTAARTRPTPRATVRTSSGIRS